MRKRVAHMPHATCHQCAAVLGSQWGDEGKGKLSDVLAKKYAPATVRAARCRFLWLTHVCCSYDIVARFNGGTNAGHTVVANGQKFAFHLLPCGLIYPHTQDYMRTDDARLVELLRAVDLNFVLERAEDGLDTRAEWGEILSGGEQQRVGFVRLLYHRPVFAIMVCS